MSGIYLPDVIIPATNYPEIRFWNVGNQLFFFVSGVDKHYKKAIKISEPHGRLCDLDELSKTIKENISSWGFGYDYGRPELEHDLNSTPIIIPAYK